MICTFPVHNYKPDITVELPVQAWCLKAPAGRNTAHPKTLRMRPVSAA